ncbi:hypothetical protein GLOIN_2v1761184 [Rhizophagus irregularis DAOM 181602=DAOM 197198]|uniref:Protein kinase domain-containing protein n=1 Tax=Rhizophagus irregularis (strain DAOM 181602 / DAOM 197198 / MUCL 43194) TaxID=747089 RepID=A0A2P4QZU1_RHIID|nr:hypothetical protein GLOIN_2v1761184 [Rhizophagus irregularis DAOM 181602=DAOM 197198]POG83164.1 hypothetical protein GLOIN_2v1761184 [Rhizophagus irregularis DAOM 181602=DAOM 197198]|eukprot:XP_025190030.1 hypothetical protein GLOIN_2v1761184 [Rhizophagus irregularis DAOM 181602=DAOM 197198]
MTEEKTAQSKARNNWEVIAYEKLINIKYLTQGGFSIIYKAIWLDGYILCWNDSKKEWVKYRHQLD